MRCIRWVVSFLVLLSAMLCAAQSEDWLPVTQEDLRYKEVPGHPGASAVRLYYRHYINDNTFSEFLYTRIKILNEKALQPGGYADVQIPLSEQFFLYFSLTDLKARTIHPDGSIVEFTGKPFEKTFFKGRGFKFLAKVFTMPDVTVGSIIEYKFRITLKLTPDLSGRMLLLPVVSSWVLQSDLYTVKEDFYFKPFEGGVDQGGAHGSIYWEGATIGIVQINMTEKPKQNGSDRTMEAHDVPALETEDTMPPEDDYKPTVFFFYNAKGTNSSEQAWRDISKDEYSRMETFLSRGGGLKEAAQEAIGAETDPVKKLKLIYDRAQKVRNLSFERTRTEEEMKKENLQRNYGVSDVLSHGYGSDREITELFVEMARAAGFDASVARASDRSERRFNNNLTTLSQIGHVIALVNLNGQDIFLEPGTKFCPFGLLRWNHTATEALKIDKKGGSFVKAVPAAYDKTITRRGAVVTISEDGSLKGTVAIEFRGYEALEHRLAAVDSDEAGRRKDLEDELKEWLPAGAIVKLTSATGWEESDQPLLANFNVEVPSYASLVGKRLVLPTYLFQVKQKDAFKHAERKYPVYFPYPFSEYDQVQAQVPAGYTVESVPGQQDASLPYAKYQNITQFDGAKVVTQRKLLVNGVYFPVEKYAELKGFFSKVQAGDEQQAVLRGGNVNAQKSN